MTNSAQIAFAVMGRKEHREGSGRQLATVASRIDSYGAALLEERKQMFGFVTELTWPTVTRAFVLANLPCLQNIRSHPDRKPRGRTQFCIASKPSHSILSACGYSLRGRCTKIYSARLPASRSSLFFAPYIFFKRLWM